MTSTIVLNQNNLINNENNTFVYKFPNSVQFPNHQIAVQSISMYYSWTNINTSLNNNSLTVTWIVGTTQTTKTIVIPTGLFEITDINNYFQYWCIQNGFYLIDDAGDYLYFFEILVNPTSYAIQINTFSVPTSLPTGYSTPDNWIGFPSSSYNPSLTISSNFNQIIGFPADYTTPLNPPLNNQNDYTYSINSIFTPQVQPNSNLLIASTNINNKYSSPASIIYSLAPSVAIGELITEQPPQLAWNNLLSGTYNEIRIQLLGSDLNPITILDPNMTILIAIRDIKEEFGNIVSNLVSGKT